MSRANEPISPVADDAFERIGQQEQMCLHPLRFRGLTIHEHFAAMAMQGFAAQSLSASSDDRTLADEIAKTSRLWADALLAELEKSK